MTLDKISDHILTINGFLSRTECEDYIERSETMGYEAATVETEKGAAVMETVRNNDRIIYTDAALAKNFWQRLQPFAPAQIGNSYAVGLNEMFRFYKYQTGQKFKRHADQSFIRNEDEASYYTFMIYLNEDFEGGETTFKNAVMVPRQGTALVFLHNLEHEGSEVKQGVKYVLRSDIMYRIVLQ